MSTQATLHKMDSVGMNGARDLVLKELRFWSASRRLQQPTLPELHRRLCTINVPMLAVPLDDFFWLCAHRQADEKASGQDRSSSIGTLVLSLLQAADDQWMLLCKHHQTWTSNSLLLLAAWAVRRQIAEELGLRFNAARKTTRHSCNFAGNPHALADPKQEELI